MPSKDQLIEDIKIELGWPIVDVELSDNVMDKILEKTMRDIQPYILFTAYKTLPLQPIIELPEEVAYVLDVYRGEPKGSPLSAPNMLNDNELLFGATAHNSMLWDTGALSGGGGNDSMTSYYLMKLFYNSIRGNTATVDFNQNGNKLYVESAMGGSSVTIEYVPIITDVEDLTDAYWYKKLYDWYLANCKISIGRARSKYRIQASKYDLDGESILREGLEEKASIIQELESSALNLVQLVE